MNGEKFNSERAPQAVGLYPHARKVGNLLFLFLIGSKTNAYSPSSALFPIAVL